jgi:hypothetical protein
MNTPKLGARFFHKTWRDTNGQPLVYQVTALRDGGAYIRADGEKKAKEFVALDRWAKVFGAAA